MLLAVLLIVWILIFLKLLKKETRVRHAVVFASKCYVEIVLH